MAQKVTVQLIDDLDGTPGDDIETVEFSVDGAVFEIDLNKGNATELREVLAPFVASARRTGGRLKRAHKVTTKPAPSPSASVTPINQASRRLVPVPTRGRGKEQTQAIRDWARAHGLGVSDRGRIAEHIVKAFDEAHTAPRSVGGRTVPFTG